MLPSDINLTLKWPFWRSSDVEKLPSFGRKNKGYKATSPFFTSATYIPPFKSSMTETELKKQLCERKKSLTLHKVRTKIIQRLEGSFETSLTREDNRTLHQVLCSSNHNQIEKEKLKQIRFHDSLLQSSSFLCSAFYLLKFHPSSLHFGFAKILKKNSR